MRLKTEQEKVKFIKDQASAWKDLGGKIKSVSDAENFLVNNTKNVIRAIQLRAEAMAIEQRNQKAYEDFFENDSRIVKQSKERHFKMGDAVDAKKWEAAGLTKPAAVDYGGVAVGEEEKMQKAQESLSQYVITSEAQLKQLNAYEHKLTVDARKKKQDENQKALDATLKQNEKWIQKVVKEQEDLAKKTPQIAVYPGAGAGPDEPKKTTKTTSKKEEEESLKGSLDALQKERATIQKYLEKGTQGKHGFKSVEEAQEKIRELDKQIEKTKFEI